MDYFLQLDGAQQGPFAISQLRSMWNAGKVNRATPLWYEGLSEWITLSAIEDDLSGGSTPVAEPSFKPQVSIEEKTIWKGNPSHFLYLWYWVLGILTAPILVGLVIILWIFIDQRKTKYEITNKRVKTTTGFLAKSTSEARIQDIRSINVVRSGVPGLFGIGAVQFGTSGQSGVEVSFNGISKAEEVKRIVSNLQR